MKVEILPSELKGKVNAPPSKSEAHRLLLAAGLSEGKSVIKNVDFSGDISATLDCLEAFGAVIQKGGGSVKIKGFDPMKAKNISLDCRECGTTARLFAPLCLLSGEEAFLTGSERLMSRPMTVYEDICEKQGIIMRRKGSGYELKGPLCAGEFHVKGNISSQFISGLLFALPLLRDGSELTVIPPFESRPYIDMTLDVISRSGVKINKADELNFSVPGNQKYGALHETVEGDWSNAAFLYALKYLGFDIEVQGLNENSFQGDKACVSYFEELKNGFARINLADCPDLAPILFAFAGMNGGGEFTGTERLKIKESNRIGEVAEELAKAGIRLEESGENRVRVYSDSFKKPDEPFFGHNDHRTVMALSVLCAVTGGVIEGAEAVAKSYPAFFDDLSNLEAKIKYDT